MLDNIHSSPVVNPNQAPIKTVGSLPPVLRNTYKTAIVKKTLRITTAETINLEKRFKLSPPKRVSLAYPKTGQLCQ